VVDIANINEHYLDMPAFAYYTYYTIKIRIIGVIMQDNYQSFKEFYPFYLSQHRNKTCRNLHFIGSSLILIMLSYAVFNAQYLLLLTLPVIGYGFAWIGHFVFEKNKPATFTYPLWSFIGDWKMFWQMLIGKL